MLAVLWSLKEFEHGNTYEKMIIERIMIFPPIIPGIFLNHQQILFQFWILTFFLTIVIIEHTLSQVHIHKFLFGKIKIHPLNRFILYPFLDLFCSFCVVEAIYRVVSTCSSSIVRILPKLQRMHAVEANSIIYPRLDHIIKM